MLLQFSIWPLDSPHMSEEIGGVARILDDLGVHYEVNAMGTTIEGDWQELLPIVHACHQAIRAAHTRVLTTITIDDDATRALNMAEAKAKVEARRQQSDS